MMTIVFTCAKYSVARAFEIYKLLLKFTKNTVSNVNDNAKVYQKIGSLAKPCVEKLV